MTKNRIPVSRPDISELEERYVLDAVRSTWISSTGPYLERFESAWAKMCGATYALGVSSGTAGLHLALLGLDVRRGDEVLVPSLTYVAVANACRYVGAEPVFVDVDPETWCIDPTFLEAAVTPRTRGVIAVHTYGHPADMDAINHFAAVHGLWVVEDAAEAHFAAYRGRPLGGLGRVGVYSFYANKVIACGEGGAVLTSDPQLAVRLRALRGQGVDPNRRYFFPVVGYNFRMTNVAAALLCAQLERAPQLLTERQRVFDRYGEKLAGVVVLQPRAGWVKCSPWMFCALLGNAAERDVVAAGLASEGVETRPFFVPLHTLPPYREQSRVRGDRLPVTEQLAATGINLPTYPGLSDADIDFICRIFKESL